MTDAETLRLSILQQTEDLGTKKRFGLFSQPISTAVGDNGGYIKKLHPRDPNTKKPVTMPRNFYVSPNKSGQLNKSYFGPINSLAASHIKDEYIQPGKRLLKQQKQKRDKGCKHQVSFFTGAGSKILSTSSYQYIQDKKPLPDGKRNRDSDGKVKSQPKNVCTNPNSKVDKQFFKPYQHLDDPYDRAHKMQLQRNRKNKSMEGQASFKPNSFAPKVFSPDKNIYGSDTEIKKKQQKQTKFNIYNHESAWKSSNPSKQGIYGFFSPFPQYKQSPKPQTKRKPSTQKTKDPIKLNNPQITSKPSPSITIKNIRRSFGH